MAEDTGVLATIARWLGVGQKSGGGRSWWGWILGVVILVVGGLAAWWIVTSDRRELARLRHEKYRRQIEADQAALDARLAATDAEVERKLAITVKAKAAVARVDLDLEEARKAYERDRQAADRITWADLRRHSAGRR